MQDDGQKWSKHAVSYIQVFTHTIVVTKHKRKLLSLIAKPLHKAE
jgi:hypothetical protein